MRIACTASRNLLRRNPSIQPAHLVKSTTERYASQCSYAEGQEGLTARELFDEAQIARLSGHCYRPWDEIKALAAEENFTVLAGGDTYFTRWYLAQGRLSGGPISSADTASSTLCLFIRGVMWRSSELDTVRVWQQLAKSWPAAYLPEKMPRQENSNAVVQAHAGMAEMTTQLYEEVVNKIRTFDGPLLIAGHSMGGSLATLLAVRFAVEGDRRAQDISCRTFGSPPALASSCGGLGSTVLRGRSIDFSIRNWVLDYDPVPRAMLSADPYFQFAIQSEGAKRALDWGQRLFGNPRWLSQTRFLFRSIGEVFLLSRIKRSDNYVPLHEETMEQELRMPVNELVSRPVLLLQTVLDHKHTSYSHDLLSAARLQHAKECKR